MDGGNICNAAVHRAGGAKRKPPKGEKRLIKALLKSAPL